MAARPATTRGTKSRRANRTSTRAPRIAATSDEKATVIGRRSQNRRASSGAAWYQAEPKAVAAIAAKKSVHARDSRRSSKARVVRTADTAERPQSPTARKPRFERTFNAFGTGPNGAVSAKRW